jgi:AraC-like DNA-binding protein
MLFSLLSLFVGFALLALIFAIFIEAGKNKTWPIFLLIFFGIIGIPRVIHGLIILEILPGYSNPFQENLIVSLLFPPIYYHFFKTLILKKFSLKSFSIHFGVALGLVVASLAIPLSKDVRSFLFLILCFWYLGSSVLLLWNFFFGKKNTREWAYFKKNKTWLFIIFFTFFTLFILGIVLYLLFLTKSNREFLTTFYNASSIIWILVILFLLRNPQILYGEDYLRLKISSPEDDKIKIWKKIKSAKTDTQDLEVEQKVKNKINLLLQTIQELEKKPLENGSPLPNLKDLAFAMDCPQSHLKYLFKYYCHHSFGEYQNALKIKFAINCMNQGYLEKRTLDSLALFCQFTNRITFYKNFKKFTGFSPTEFQSIQEENLSN